MKMVRLIPKKIDIYVDTYLVERVVIYHNYRIDIQFLHILYSVLN